MLSPDGRTPLFSTFSKETEENVSTTTAVEGNQIEAHHQRVNIISSPPKREKDPRIELSRVAP